MTLFSHSPWWYAIALAGLIVIQRLPGVIAPNSFKNGMIKFARNRRAVKISGLLITLPAIYGLAITIVNYETYGWLVIGLLLVVLHKSLGFLFMSEKSARREQIAWDQPDGNIRIICTLSVMFGLILLCFAIIRL